MVCGAHTLPHSWWLPSTQHTAAACLSMALGLSPSITGLAQAQQVGRRHPHDCLLNTLPYFRFHQNTAWRQQVHCSTQKRHCEMVHLLMTAHSLGRGAGVLKESVCMFEGSHVSNGSNHSWTALYLLWY